MSNYELVFLNSIWLLLLVTIILCKLLWREGAAGGRPLAGGPMPCGPSEQPMSIIL